MLPPNLSFGAAPPTQVLSSSKTPSLALVNVWQITKWVSIKKDNEISNLLFVKLIKHFVNKTLYDNELKKFGKRLFYLVKEIERIIASSSLRYSLLLN